MVLLKSPLNGSGAKGMLGGFLIYQKSRAGYVLKGNRLIANSYFAFFKKYYFSETVLQQAVRNTFIAGKNAWKNLNQEEKADYNRLGKKINLSGYSFFIKDFINGYYDPDDFVTRWLLAVRSYFAISLFREEEMSSFLVVESIKRINGVN